MNKLRLFLGLGLLGLGGCETIVEVDTPPHTPRLALNYTLSNAPALDTANNSQNSFERRRLFVSSSQGVLETKELNGRSDAKVELFDENGQLVEQFFSKPSYYGRYQPTRGFAGVPGRAYTLRASAPGVEAVEASLTLPNVPVIESAGYVAKSRDPNSSNNYYNYTGRLTVAVADNPATTDYYLAYARVFDKQGKYWGAVSRDSNVPGNDGPDINLSRFQLSQLDSYSNQYPYSDAGNSGSLLGFGADVRLYFRGDYTGGVFPEPGYIEVIVSSITPDTYRLYQSVRRYYDTEDSPFAEPAPLHSNIRSGYGLFGGATDVVYRIQM